MIQSWSVLSNRMSKTLETPTFDRFHVDMQRLLLFLNYIADKIGMLEIPEQTEFVSHIPLVFELTFCRSIDNFLTYVSESLTSIFEKRPEMLKSSDVMTVEEIFSYPTRDELLSALIEKKVLALSFKGMKDLNDYLRKTVGFELFPKAEHLQHAIVLIEKRNLAIHNRCLVNRRYLERVPDSGLKIGDRITFVVNEVGDDIAFLADAVLDIETRAIQKFKLWV